jgi:putative transposase
MQSLKIRLELNNKQKTLALQHAGVARHAYNWGLDVCNKAFKNKEKRPTSIDLHKKLVAEVKKKYSWYYEVSKCAPQQALRDLDTSFQRFFKKVSKYPTFKKKGRKDSFYLEGNIEIKNNRIKLPIFGWIKLSEKIKDLKGVKNVRISRRADFWFVSFKTEAKKEKIKYAKNSFVGVDLGIKTLATLSNGMSFENKRPYKFYKRKLKIEQRKLSKKYQKNKSKKEQSKNYYKQQKVVAQLHYKIACIREDSLHKLTTYLAKNHVRIAIEDLNVKGISKNHKLSSAILDGGFYEFRRQLTYKCEWYGSKLVVVDRFFPSSKLCSNCGHKKEKLYLSERIYSCEKCGLRMDRDLNASVNLAKHVVS